MNRRDKRGPLCDCFRVESLYERLGGHRGISTLLHHFYADVRQHQVIGPIFTDRIKDWPAHILKITEFWVRGTGGPSMYAGQMPVKHLELDLQPEHFTAWLELWDFNCRRHLGAAEAEDMSRLAHNIGARLRQIVAIHAGANASNDQQIPILGELNQAG